MLTITFLAFWIANLLVIWIIGQLAPNSVVLGNEHLSPVAASAFAGFVLTTVNILVEPTTKLAKLKLKRGQWEALFIAVNTVSLWIITRMALAVGVGISAFWWAAILGVATTGGQWVAWKLLKLDKNR